MEEPGPLGPGRFGRVCEFVSPFEVAATDGREAREVRDVGDGPKVERAAALFRGLLPAMLDLDTGARTPGFGVVLPDAVIDNACLVGDLLGDWGTR